MNTPTDNPAALLPRVKRVIRPILSGIAWLYVNLFCLQTWQDRRAIWRFNQQMKLIKKELRRIDKQGHW